MLPASINGSQAAFGAHNGDAPNFSALTSSGCPKVKPKFTNDAPNPHKIERTNPLPMEALARPAAPLSTASRRRPATAQILTPIITRITPAITPPPAAVKSWLECKRSSGSKLPTSAADIPNTIENVSAIPITTLPPAQKKPAPRPIPRQTLLQAVSAPFQHPDKHPLDAVPSRP